MNSASPTTSTSTNRGGRPKDWTDPRARRLVRLYIYTRLPFELILKLLEEGVWKPGKDAANKVKNSLLGNDPRWIRPKDEDDERRRIAGLKNSRRGTRFRQRTSSSHLANEHLTVCGSGWHDDDSLTLAQSNQPSFEYIKQEPNRHSSEVGANFPNITYHDNYDDNAALQFSWSLNNSNTSRRDTNLTNSTETSMSSSFQEKLSTVSRDQAKGAWRVLKRYTFPQNPDINRRNAFSPVLSPGPSGAPMPDPFSSRHALPGDFLNTDLFNGENKCGVGSPSHEAETCWCRIVNELRPPYETWPINNDHPTIYDIYSNSLHEIRDPFGNTVFHWLAGAIGDRNYFLNLITQALSQNLQLIHATNTAGQTFLHLLHNSWFDDEILLERLLNMLRDADFNILATDVYGRSFFHLLQNKKRDSIRIPEHLFNRELLQRRDAFGVKPMDSQAQQPEPPTAQGIPRVNPLNTRGASNAECLLGVLEIPSDRGDDAQIRTQAELVRIVVDAIKVDPVNSTNQNSLTEDAHGRNALHALAEVELDIDRVQHPTYDNQRHKKRKFKEEEGEPRPDSSHNSKRLEFLEGIIASSVDVNHYDNRGQTPLMAFIALRPEDSRSDKEDMERFIRKIVEAGANLEQRNREGKTALHVAACSGKKVALKELLQLGANPYVRDACGLSVLAAIDEIWIHTERDGALTARLEACRGVFTSLVQPDAQEPSVVQEWGVRRPTPRL
ncbi:ankyrin [Daldinia caldariorum]|uniref:ankyrin n=1 Tax=Daldinia caldariorum TaxID=326644 RepID=UPI002008558B|nr:ankyrin [Daldinia caldariorum]KAI1471744.1 ankyrin [Daldinia caldariorum]